MSELTQHRHIILEEGCDIYSKRTPGIKKLDVNSSHITCIQTTHPHGFNLLLSGAHTHTCSVTRRDAARLDPICHFCLPRSSISAEICAHSQLKSNWHQPPVCQAPALMAQWHHWVETRAVKVMSGQEEQAVLDKNKNKLQCCTHILIRWMMVERRGRGGGEGLDKLEQIPPLLLVKEKEWGEEHMYCKHWRQLCKQYREVDVAA